MCENIYISPAGEESLKTFKYKGGSDSFLYEHLWGPLSQFIVYLQIISRRKIYFHLGLPPI